MFTVVECKIVNLRKSAMKKILLLFLLFLNTSCTIFEAGRLTEERKKLFNKNNDKEFCDQNPDRCVNNIPWS